MNLQTVKSELLESSSTKKMRTSSLDQLASGVAKREAEKPDFELFTRNAIFTRIDEMIDDLAEKICDLAVDDTVEDLLKAKNVALSDALSARETAESKAKHFKELEKSEGERRHKIILELRGEIEKLTAQNLDLTKEVDRQSKKFEHEKKEGLRRHGIILELREKVAEADLKYSEYFDKYEYEKDEGLRRHGIILDLRAELSDVIQKYEHQKNEGLRRHRLIQQLRKDLKEVEQRVVYHVNEREEFIRQREYARTFPYLIKTLLSRFFEILKLKKKPVVE